MDNNGVQEVVTCEEYSIIGGLRKAVYVVIVQHGLVHHKIWVGINDEFGHSGPSEKLLQHFGLCVEHIEGTAKGLCISM